MVKPNETRPDSFTIELQFVGGGDYLWQLQQALLLGIEAVGSRTDFSGDENHQRAVWLLSSLLKEFMLNESQLNVGMGGSPYNFEIKR